MASIEKHNKAEEKEVKVDLKNPVMFIGWDLEPQPNTVGYPVKDVIEKMEELGLPEEAGEIRSRSAIIRAIRDAGSGKDKTVAILVDNDERLAFQITKVSLEDDKLYGKLAHYAGEIVVTYFKKDNEIKCKSKTVRAYVTEKYLLAQKHYRTNDITKILLRLFRKHGDIISLRPKKGGAYMIPSAYAEYVDKVKELIRFLNPANYVVSFKIGAAEAQKEMTPAFIDNKANALRKFRQGVLELAEKDVELKKENKKLSIDSPTIKKNRMRELAQLKKSIALWERSLQVESEELRELIRKCDVRLKKHFGA